MPPATGGSQSETVWEDGWGGEEWGRAQSEILGSFQRGEYLPIMLGMGPEGALMEQWLPTFTGAWWDSANVRMGKRGGYPPGYALLG